MVVIPRLSPPSRVYGCVIGIQQGRTVEIFNSSELLYDSLTSSLDRGFLEKKQELYKKIFPNFYVIGWFSTGIDAQESDMFIHKALMDINESPVLLFMFYSIAQKDLPVSIFESANFCWLELHLETVEAERISVDHVAHLKPADGSSVGTQLAATLARIHSAIKMLNTRVKVLLQYLLAVQKVR